MKRQSSPPTDAAERPELRLQEAIPDGRQQAGESASAEARYALRRAILHEFQWVTERKAYVTLH
jgi:hypothetical protein